MSKLINIVFLDMDGVVCNPRACIAMGNKGISSYLDPIACMLVKRLCVENNARIVMSSAWRGMYNKHALEAILNAACPGLGDLIIEDEVWWKTRSWVHSDDDKNTSDRGREIEHWIFNNITRFNNYVILDDMHDMRPLQDNLVRCSTYDGIGFFQWEEADKILKAYP